jgi:hypothetical protein
MAMNETDDSGAGGVAGVLLGAIFSAALVDGAQGPFVETAGAWFLAACCCERALPGWILLLSPAVIGSGCWRVSSDLSSPRFL